MYEYLLYVKGAGEDVPPPPEGVEIHSESEGVLEVRLPAYPSRALVEEVVKWLTELSTDGSITIYDPQRGVILDSIPTPEELHAHTSMHGHVITESMDPGAYGEVEGAYGGSFFERHPTLVVLGSIVILYFLMDLGLRLLFGCNGY